MHTRGEKLHRARWALALTVVTGMATSTLALPAQGAVGAARSVIVSKDESIVLVDGLTPAQEQSPVTIEVRRGGALVGSVTEIPQDFGVAGAMEVNHLDDPTLCWQGFTPIIEPGDVVHVIGSGFADTVAVADIEILHGVTGIDTNADTVHDAFTVKGRVGFPAGGPRPPTNQLNVFIRYDFGGDQRPDPDSLTYDDASSGNWTATFTGTSPDEIAAASNAIVLEGEFLTAGNEITTAVPGATRLEDPNCPAVAGHAIGRVTPGSYNLANRDTNLVVDGITLDSSQVSVELSDADPSTASHVRVVDTGDTGSQSWSATFTAAEVNQLVGSLTVTATHTPTGGGTAIQNVRQVPRDVVAPAAPTVSPGGGAVSGPTSVFISGGGGDALRYTVGNGSQPAPTANSGIGFGGPFTVVPGQTVKAIAVDAAGNPSTVTTAAFTQAVVPPVVTPPSSGGSAILPLAPGIAKAKSGKPGGVKTAKARWRAPEANGAVINGYRVRAFKIRPGMSAKKVKVVRIGASKTRVKMVLPRGTYRFQVRASSTAGKSSWSARSNKVRSR